MTTIPIQIRLTRGFVALVDPVDAHLASLRWYAQVFKNIPVVYAARRVRRPDGTSFIEYLHQAVLGLKGIDHRDGNGLDCRRSNLREASKAQNQRNQRRRKDNMSGFKGVYWHAQRGYWIARIKAGPIRKSTNGFTTAIEAARAYDAMAREFHGEFAHLNFPGKSP